MHLISKPALYFAVGMCCAVPIQCYASSRVSCVIFYFFIQQHGLRGGAAGSDLRLAMGWWFGATVSFRACMLSAIFIPFYGELKWKESRR